MQVTQKRLKESKEFSELVGLVFWSVIRENSLDPATGLKIDFSDLPVFSDAAPAYASGDNVVSWDDYWVLVIEPTGMPYVGRRSETDGSGTSMYPTLLNQPKKKRLRTWKLKLTTSGFIVKLLTGWWLLCTTTARSLLKKR